MSFLLAVAVVVAAAVVLWYLFPEATERWLTRVLLARKIVFGAGAVILALFLLSTGAFGLMVIGGAVLLLVVLYVLEDPNGELEEYLP